MERRKVFLADRDGTWRSALAERLRSEELALIETADGAALLRALREPTEAPDVAIIGHELELLDGLEALYLASQQPGRADLAAVFLVTEVRSDREQLALWERRGVTGFLHRGDLIARSAAAVRNSLFADARSEPRHAVTLPARISTAGLELDAMVEDLSLCGALVSVVAHPELSLAVGDRVRLAFRVAEHQVRCEGELRRLSTSYELFGVRLAFGLRFDFPAEAGRAALAKAVEEISKEIPATQLYGALGAP